VHGIVFARAKVKGKKVAYVKQRSTYFHEADSVIGFGQLNEPGLVTGVAGFKQAVQNINFTFNWAYVDSEDIAYALSGAYPQRAKGTSPDFPVLGTGAYDWLDYDTELHTMRTVPLETIAHPHVELLGAARLLKASR
jgi:acyl-homoserine lactone acylase PvdQ